MADPLRPARDICAALLAELSRLRRDAPDDAELLGAEQAAQALAARLAPRTIIEPPYPNVADKKP